jgi:filamentous hemagglutinin
MKEQDNDKVSSPFAKGTCYFLIYLTGIYPINSAVAGGITPANSQTQVQNNGNVPVVNIAAPNSAGVSHNTYQDFNTGTQGAVLNNATQAVNSQLAGQINANANLQGKAADLIINEVTGSSRSELLGQLEVAGQKANVMIANPNGITCDGCGFINTSGAILTTGKPQFDAKGALEALDVTKGQITIGGKGLNGQSTDYIDIISRATELNGKIQANNLTLTQGANQVSFKDGTAKTITGEGAAPQLAVDTKALGGMYANKIRLIATENGVGVNLKDITSTQGDITLSASGKAELANIKAKTDLNIGGKEITIAPNTSVQAEQDMILAGDKITNRGSVIAGQDMRVYGNTLSNIGAPALLQANNNLWMQKNVDGDKSELVENRSATIKTNSGDLIIRSNNIINERENLKIGKQTQQMNVESKTEGQIDPAKSIYADLFHKDSKLEHTDFISEVNSSPAVINSGNNAYLYGDKLFNKNSNILAKDSLILTGNNLENIGFFSGVLEKYKEHYRLPDRGKKISDRNILIWKTNNILEATLKAANNLVADFKESIIVKNTLPNEARNINQAILDKSQISLNAKNVVLHTKNIDIASGIKANNNISIIADNSVNTLLSSLVSGENIAITSGGDINLSEGNLKSKNIALISHEGEISIKDPIRAFNLDNTRWINNLDASDDLTLSAGKNIYIKDTLFPAKSKNIAFNANQSITLEHTDDLLNQHNAMYPLPIDQESALFSTLPPITTLNSSGSILMNSGGNLSLNRVNLDADKDIELYSGYDFNHYFNEVNPYNFRALTITTVPNLRAHIKSGNDFIVNARHDITLEGSEILTKGSTSLLSGNATNLLVMPYKAFSDNLAYITHYLLFTKKSFPRLATTIESNKDINIISGGEILAEIVKLSADGNIIASSNGNMNFESYQFTQTIVTEKSGALIKGTMTKTINKVSELTAGGILKLFSNGSILFEATKLTAKGLGAVWQDPIPVSNHGATVVSGEDNVRNLREKFEIVKKEKNLIENDVDKLKQSIEEAEKKFQLQVETLRKQGKKVFKEGALKAIIGAITKNDRDALAPKLAQLAEIEPRFNQAKNELDAANNQLAQARQEAQDKGDSEIKLQADIDAHNNAEAMRIGTIDVAAKGGYLYAKAQQNSERRQATRHSAGGLFSSSKSTTEVSQKTGYDVGEFTAAGNITMLSHDDSTYEATKINAGKNIRLISTHGQVNFKAMPNTAFEQVITSSEGMLFNKQSDKGYNSTTWTLPTINAGNLFTVDANSGINADIKTQKGESLQTALKILGENPETAWLKELNNRPDVKWNQVQDAYESWDYHNQQLAPVASAIIAIAVAVVTAGAGATLTAAQGAATAASGAAATAGTTAATATTIGTVASGATIAGISSLASKAAVTLVNNQGNLSKTFKDLGNSDTVKSTITSMAIGGALAGFDYAMGWSKAAPGATAAKEGANAATSSTTATTPLLNKGADWITVAQRVAGQSLISSGLNTTINGGSFKDNFAAALLANVGNQVNMEGAHIIGNNGAILGIPGKVLSHTAVSALAAEIGGGDAKGAAAGALAAGLAAVAMESTLFDAKYKNESEQQFHKIQEALQGNETKAQAVQVIGALSGALISGTPEGVYSAANSADIVHRYNYTHHQWMQIFQENGRDMAAAAEGDEAAAQRVKGRQEGAAAALMIAGGGYAVVYGGTILAAATPEVLFAGRMAIETCKMEGAFCFSKIGIFAADVMAPEAALGTGALGAGTVKILGYSSESVKDLAIELKHASSALLSKSGKPDTHAVTSLVAQETKRETVADVSNLINKAGDELTSSGFFKRSNFEAPSGNNYTVYQQHIDWDLPVNTKYGTKTNLEVALGGDTPFVVKDGKYNQINLHHSNQNGLGPLFELSRSTHKEYHYSNALHPHLPKAHPDYPVDRELFSTDRAAYWVNRAQTELKSRLNSNK